MDAEEAAERELISRHKAEFDELLRVAHLRNGIGSVTIRRTIIKQVTEMEAEILCRNGWEKVAEWSL